MLSHLSKRVPLDHTRWIRRTAPSVRVQHCFRTPRRGAGRDLAGKRQEWGHPENNNKEPSFSIRETEIFLTQPYIS
jgi:hypothetical protein